MKPWDNWPTNLGNARKLLEFQRAILHDFTKWTAVGGIFQVACHLVQWLLGSNELKRGGMRNDFLKPGVLRGEIREKWHRIRCLKGSFHGSQVRIRLHRSPQIELLMLISTHPWDTSTMKLRLDAWIWTNAAKLEWQVGKSDCWWDEKQDFYGLVHGQRWAFISKGWDDEHSQYEMLRVPNIIWTTRCGVEYDR